MSHIIFNMCYFNFNNGYYSGDRIVKLLQIYFVKDTGLLYQTYSLNNSIIFVVHLY